MRRGIFYSLCISGLLLSPVNAHESFSKNNIMQLVTYKANQHGISEKFAHAIIRIESNYNPNAKNGSATGLGQIKCKTAKGLGLSGSCSKLYEPDTNLEMSFKYLKMALNKSNGDYCHAATLYNRGLYGNKGNSSYCTKVLRYM